MRADRLAVLVLLSGFAISVQGQSWPVRYNGPGNARDGVSAMAVDSEGNVYVTGPSKGLGTGMDYATIKYDSQGSRLWVRRYDRRGGDDEPVAMAVDDQGNVYVTGTSWDSNARQWDYATVKYDTDGALDWVARYDGPRNGIDRPSAISVDGKGYTYVTGYSAGRSAYGYATVKYDPYGNEVWSRRYESSNDAEATALALDRSGNVYVTGFASFGDGNKDYATLKYDSGGGLVWIQKYNGPGNSADVPVGVSLDGRGNVYVVGTSYLRYDSTPEIALVKYTPGGTQKWSERLGVATTGGSGLYASAIACDGVGNVIVTGTVYRSGTTEFVTAKYDTLGLRKWVQRYGAPSKADVATALAVDADGNIYVTGNATRSSRKADSLTVRYDAGGVRRWAQRYVGPGTDRDRPSSIVVGPSGYVYVAGSYFGVSTSSDFLILRYAP